MHASARPIISADAVAVVRRGLRSEFWPARLPTVPNTRRYVAAPAARNGRLITGLTAVTPSSTTRIPRPEHPAAARDVGEQAGAHRGGTHADAPPARAEADGGSRSPAARCRRAAPAPARSGSSGGPGSHAAAIVTSDADDVAGQHGARSEDQRLPGEVETEVREERRGSPSPAARRGPARASSRPRRRTNASNSTERVTCRFGRAEGAQQGELAAALRDQDRERVDDQEGADDQRDAGEDQQERAQEPDRLEQVGGAPRRPRRRR